MGESLPFIRLSHPGYAGFLFLFHRIQSVQRSLGHKGTPRTLQLKKFKITVTVRPVKFAGTEHLDFPFVVRSYSISIVDLAEQNSAVNPTEGMSEF